METRIGFGRRLGAYVIDIIFIVGIAYILFSLFGDFFERFVDFSEINDAQLDQFDSMPGTLGAFFLTLGVSVTLASFAYNLVEGFLGYTVGKLMLGIQIGNQDGTSAKMEILMARYAIKNISTLVGLVGLAVMISVVSTISSVLGIVILIGCFFALGEKKLALHDMIAKTAVFRKSELEDGTAAKPMFSSKTEE